VQKIEMSPHISMNPPIIIIILAIDDIKFSINEFGKNPKLFLHVFSKMG